MMFAQTDLPNVPAEILKWVLIVIVAIGLIALAVWGAFRKPEKTKVKVDDDPPIEVRKAPKRFNHDLAEQRFADHERRLLTLENWRHGLIEKMETDKREIVDAGEQRASRIHEHIENDRREMDRKIESLFDRIIATLKNMGKI